MADDEKLPDDQLPSGLTPIWIQLPPAFKARKSYAIAQMLARVNKIPEIRAYKNNVIVLRDGVKKMWRIIPT